MVERRRASWSGAAVAALAWSLALPFGAGAAHAETLQEAIALAYDTNPDLQQQRALQRALDENYVQARSGFRPTASASATAGVDNGPNGFGGSSTDTSSSASISVSQPIYSGGRISTTVDAVQADILQGRENLRQTESSVLQSVVQSFVDVRRDIEALRINQENVRVLQRQLEEASARFDVGEITRTDVAQAQARLAASQSSLASAQAQLSVSRANYASVVGQTPTNLEPEPVLPGMPDGFDQAIDVAQQDNPGLRAAQYAQQASQARVAAARAEYRPNLGLNASYGTAFSPGGGSLTDRDDFRATASFSIPLFTGGLNGSRVRQALERDNSALIGIDGARRIVLQQVSQAWALVLSTKASLTASDEQVRAATIAAEGVRQEAQVGLRTTLDVLNAELELRDAQLAQVNARRNNYVATAQLLSAMGRLEAKDLVNTVQVYDPKANFDRIKHKGAVPWEPLVEAVDKIAKPTGDHVSERKQAPVDQQLKRNATAKPLPAKP
jgi:outer membrane protein